MRVSDRFAQAALDLDGVSCFLPCTCGQVHFGAPFSRRSRDVRITCSICRDDVHFDLSHVGTLPQDDCRVFEHHLPYPVTAVSPIQADLIMTPGLLVSGRRTWRLGPGRPLAWVGEQLLGVFDARGALIHLGYYRAGHLIRGVFLHHESGFIHYKSTRSSITYERGLVEGPILPALNAGDAVAIVHRSFRVWRRRLLKRVVAGAQVRPRERISSYPH